MSRFFLLFLFGELVGLMVAIVATILDPDLMLGERTLIFLFFPSWFVGWAIFLLTGLTWANVYDKGKPLFTTRPLSRRVVREFSESLALAFVFSCILGGCVVVFLVVLAPVRPEGVNTFPVQLHGDRYAYVNPHQMKILFLYMGGCLLMFLLSFAAFRAIVRSDSRRGRNPSE